MNKELFEDACKEYSNAVGAMGYAIEVAVDEHPSGSLDFDDVVDGIIVKRKVKKNDKGGYIICDEEDNEIADLGSMDADYLYDICRNFI